MILLFTCGDAYSAGGYHSYGIKDRLTHQKLMGR